MKFFLVVDHDYLGFFYFTTFVEVKVVVFCYTKDIIKLFYKNDLTDKVTTAPTVDHLFRVKSNPNCYPIYNQIYFMNSPPKVYTYPNAHSNIRESQYISYAHVY